MEISAEREGGALIARATGRIDSSNSRQFHTGMEAVIADDGSAVVLSFEDVTYISSAGMRVILITAKSLQSKGMQLVLCSMNGSIREVFKISGFDKIIPIHDSQSEALTAVGA